MTTTSQSHQRNDAGAFLATVFTRATSRLREIRARQEAARAVHSLRVLSDHQRRDLGLTVAKVELLVSGLASPSMVDGHADA